MYRLPMAFSRCCCRAVAVATTRALALPPSWPGGWVWVGTGAAGWVETGRVETGWVETGRVETGGVVAVLGGGRGAGVVVGTGG